MMWFQRFLAGVAVWACLMTAPAVAGPELTLISVNTYPSLQLARPDFKRPNDGNQVFYIQRSSNANTVVYAALFDKAGNLKPRGPIHGYWRRFNTGNDIKKLSFTERNFAYGVKARTTDDPGVYDVRFAALPGLTAQLRQSAPGKAALWFDINGKQVKLIYAYLELDEGGLIPNVVALTFYGRDVATGRYMTLKYSVAGGALE